MSLKLFLANNKIYFETVAAVMLSVMAIIISAQQLRLSARQTSLLEIQTEAAKKQALLSQVQIEQQRKDSEYSTAIQAKQTHLLTIQSEAAKRQADLINKNMYLQQRELVITQAREWSNLREALIPIKSVNKYITNRTLTRKEMLHNIFEIEKLISPLGANPVLINSKINYKRFLAMLSALDGMKIILNLPELDEDTIIQKNHNFTDSVTKVHNLAFDIWFDLGMSTWSRQFDDNKFPEPSFPKSLPWERTLIDNTAVHSSTKE